MLSPHPPSDPHVHPASHRHDHPASDPHNHMISNTHDHPDSHPHDHPASHPHDHPASHPHDHMISDPHVHPASHRHDHPASDPHDHPAGDPHDHPAGDPHDHQSSDPYSIKIDLTNTDDSSYKQAQCTFDKYGNVYFSPLGKPDQVYEISITRNNSIVCERYLVNPEFDTGSINVGELIPFYNNTTLRGKIIKEQEENDDDDDSDNELTEDVQRAYLSENLEFNEYICERNTDQPYFSFNLSFQNQNADIEDKLVFNRELIHALYDTLIYQGTPDSSNLLMKTTLVNDIPLYRMCIFTSGDIKFRAIGAPESSYKLISDKGSIKVISL
jgi:hypothetical protein